MEGRQDFGAGISGLVLTLPYLGAHAVTSQPGPRQEGLAEQGRCEQFPRALRAGRLNVLSRGSRLQIWMNAQRDCTTASLEGCCARTSSVPSCASARQECSAGPMERAAQVPRARLRGVPSGGGDHPLLGICHVRLSNSSSLGFPMRQNFQCVLVDAYPCSSSTGWHRVMPRVLSIESFRVRIKLLCTELLLEGQHWTAQTWPAGTQSPAPLLAQQLGHLQVGTVQTREAGH